MQGVCALLAPGETLERDTFFSADEAKAFGLIDEVVTRRPVIIEP